MYNGLHAYSPPIPADVIASSDFVDVCYDHCRIMAPVQRWLVELVELQRA